MKNISNIFDKRLLLISVIHFLFSFFSDRFFFDFNNINYLNYIIIKIILFIVLFMFWNVGVQYIIKYYDKYKTLYKAFLIYLIIIFFMFLLAYPGTWFGNDLTQIYNSVQTCDFYYWLHYLTSLFYILSYMFLPITCAPIIFQLILYAITFAYIFYKVNDDVKSNYKWLFLIIFLLPHTIFYTFYVNRMTLVGILYLLLMSIMFFDCKRKTKLTKQKFVLLTFLSTFISCIRSETIILILFVPIIIMYTYHNGIDLKSVVKYYIIFILSFILISMPQRIHDSLELKKSGVPSDRNLPIFVMPFSNMLNYNDFEISDSELRIIDKVLNVKDMKKYSSYNDTICMWLSEECVRKYNTDEYNDFKKTAIKVLLNNKKQYMYVRYNVFIASSSINGDFFTNFDLYKSNDQTIYDRRDTNLIFSYKIRRIFYKIIEGKTNNGIYNELYKKTNNLLIPIIAIICAFIYSIYKRKITNSLITGSLICNGLIVFLTAPGGYFMYYFSLYLLGWFFIVYFLYKKLANKRL